MIDRPLPSGLPQARHVADLVDFARRTRVDLLIVTLPLTAEARLLEMLKQLWVLPVDIRLSAYMQRCAFGPAPIPMSAIAVVDLATGRFRTGTRS